MAKSENGSPVAVQRLSMQKRELGFCSSETQMMSMSSGYNCAHKTRSVVIPVRLGIDDRIKKKNFRVCLRCEEPDELRKCVAR